MAELGVSRRAVLRGAGGAAALAGVTTLVTAGTAMADPVSDAQALVQQARDALAADPGNAQKRNALSWSLTDRLAPAQKAAGRAMEAEAAAREGIDLARALMTEPGADLNGYAQRLVGAGPSCRPPSPCR